MLIRMAEMGLYVVGNSSGLVGVAVVILVGLGGVLSVGWYGGGSDPGDLEPMVMSAQERNSSCGPQPTAPVPFGQLPQLLPKINQNFQKNPSNSHGKNNIPATYLHCNMQCSHCNCLGSRYFISYTLFPSLGKYLTPLCSTTSCGLTNCSIFLSRQCCIGSL